MVKHTAQWPNQSSRHMQLMLAESKARIAGDVALANRLQAERWSNAMGLILNSENTDRKTMAERKWRERPMPSKPQAACDHGLFSDEKDQLDFLS